MIKKFLLFILILIPALNLKEFVKAEKIISKDPIKRKNVKEIEWNLIESDFNNFKPVWQLLDENKINENTIREQNIKLSKNKTTINSLNRSIVINDLVGPDVSWIVPLGLKWSSLYRFDTSLRGYSRRNSSQNFLNWNQGDGVGEFHYQAFHFERSSIGLNLGIRSIYYGKLGGNTSFGEGLSAGFRYDKKLSDSSGYAFGGEQLLHFDNLTDTGRNLYIAFSKAWWDKNNLAIYPITIGTLGIGTGKLAEGNVKGLCSDLLGGSGTEIKNQRSLCWAPIFSIARVHNKKLSTFFEYNSKWFLIGSSIRPLKELPLRASAGILISDHVDNYKVHNFNELRWVFRLNYGF